VNLYSNVIYFWD